MPKPPLKPPQPLLSFRSLIAPWTRSPTSKPCSQAWRPPGLCVQTLPLHTAAPRWQQLEAENERGTSRVLDGRRPKQSHGDSPKQRRPKFRQYVKDKRFRRFKPARPQAISSETKIINAHCTAREYNLEKLLVEFQRHYQLCPFITENVYHFRISQCEGDQETREFFVFRSGCVVGWNLKNEHWDRLLREMLVIRGLELGRYEEPETEEFTYTENDSQTTWIDDEVAFLGKDENLPLVKLAISQGLARSAKLAILEESLEDYLESTHDIPSSLARGNRLSISRTQVLQNIGQIVSLRSQLNLSADESFLDTPEFYWTQPTLEEYYSRVTRVLDVVPRSTILNKKLDYASFLVEVLRDQLNERHSSNLEIFIILLILVEVLFEILHFHERTSDRGRRGATEDFVYTE